MKYIVQETEVRRDGKVIRAIDRGTYKGVSIYCARTLLGALVMKVVLKRNLKKAWKDALKLGVIKRAAGGSWVASDNNKLFLEQTNPYSYITFNTRVIYRTRIKALASIRYKRLNTKTRSMFLFLLETKTLLKIETPAE